MIRHISYEVRGGQTALHAICQRTPLYKTGLRRPLD